ncbi:hypothetical protein ACLOJK_025795 [Asimina triloba]
MVVQWCFYTPRCAAVTLLSVCLSELSSRFSWPKRCSLRLGPKSSWGVPFSSLNPLHCPASASDSSYSFGSAVNQILLQAPPTQFCFSACSDPPKRILDENADGFRCQPCGWEEGVRESIGGWLANEAKLHLCCGAVFLLEKIAGTAMKVSDVTDLQQQDHPEWEYTFLGCCSSSLKWSAYQMTKSLAALIGGAAGVVGLVGILVFLWFCFRHNRSVSRTSETGSSDPSLQVGQGVELPHAGAASLPANLRVARRFTLEELNLATKNFSNINLVGEGKFGEVYKGLLHDGIIVAIKRRHGAPSQAFVEEVWYLSSIHHRNIVSLLGYCLENNQQMLAYEYVPNGSVSGHLYGAGQVSNERLEFKHRLSVALGAAKGMEHLHTLNPPLLHKNFKTRNVLVDENFIAKVADVGLINLLGRIDVVGPSSQIVADDVFLDPEYFSSYLISNRDEKVKEFGRFSEKSDVYSFGVFLLELVTGQEASRLRLSESKQSILEWELSLTICLAAFLKVRSCQDTSDIMAVIDPRLRGSFTAEGMNEFIWLMARCVDQSSERRPTMNFVASELDRILEKEMSLTTIMGEGTTVVTLGSQLFTASR